MPRPLIRMLQNSPVVPVKLTGYDAVFHALELHHQRVCYEAESLAG